MHFIEPLFPSSGLMEKDFFVCSEQDGLFFGLEFLNDFLEKYEARPKTKAYFQDGDCIFKGQICIEVRQQKDFQAVEDCVSILSYFSGAYTLISCFTEKQFDFSVSASPTPGFSFKEWEKKTILKAGGKIQSFPKSLGLDSKETYHRLQRKENPIILTDRHMSHLEIKNILQNCSPSSEIFLEGDFWPEDLENFRNMNLKSVWPTCLQGFFPSMKMSWAPPEKI